MPRRAGVTLPPSSSFQPAWPGKAGGSPSLAPPTGPCSDSARLKRAMAGRGVRRIAGDVTTGTVGAARARRTHPPARAIALAGGAGGLLGVPRAPGPEWHMQGCPGGCIQSRQTGSFWPVVPRRAGPCPFFVCTTDTFRVCTHEGLPPVLFSGKPLPAVIRSFA